MKIDPSDWIISETPLNKEMFDHFKGLTRKLSSSDQLLFLKKVINEIAKENVSLTITDLSEIKAYSLEAVQEFGEPKELDYKLDLILHTLKFIDSNGKFPHDSKEVFVLVKDLADFICAYLQNNTEYLTKINLLFDNCPGRTAIVRKSPDDSYVHLRGNNYKVYRIYQGYTIENIDRKTGKGTVNFKFEDGIYAKGNIFLLEIIDNKTSKEGYENVANGSYIEYDGKLYPFQWKKDNNNYLITPDSAPVECCEGRKSPNICNFSGKEFWWCYGRQCYKVNQIDHNTNEWRNYSLRDLLKILKLPFNEDGYYTFVSEINRLNRLLERIKCADCNSVLRPSKQTHFGFYRVSYFHCNNEQCSSFQKEIYLTHCLNSKCTNIIDSRVAKRCENGFIICDKCGSCCSNDQFSRRIGSLKANGQIVSQKLLEMFNNKDGHWEKTECYCYKCQKEMEEDKGGGFVCNDCNIYYGPHNVYVKFFKEFKIVREKKRQIEKVNFESNHKSLGN